MKYFCEKAPHYHLTCAGSLLGITLQGNTSFPVGKANFLSLYPISFEEFLIAVGKERLSDYLYSLNKEDIIESAFHNELVDLYKSYIYIGGMPEVVDCYIKTRDLNKVRVKQEEILNSYLKDFSKHVSPEITLKIKLIWESLPSQLARENKKFIFSAVAKGARARDYELSLQWLIDAGLIIKSSLVLNPGIPLDIAAEKSMLKCYFLDVGLLGARLKIQQNATMLQDQLLSQFRGALAENVVAQELAAHGFSATYY